MHNTKTKAFAIALFSLISVTAAAEWTNQKVILSQDTQLLAVAASSPTHACAAGLQQKPDGSGATGLMFCTSDGETWQSSQTSAWGSSMIFVDENRGFLGDVTGKVFVTETGGSVWARLPNVTFGGTLFTAKPVSDFAVSKDGQRIIVVAENGAFGASTDGGANWQKAGTAAPIPGGGQIKAKAVSVVGDHIWIAGGDPGAEPEQDMDGEEIPARPGGAGFVIHSPDWGATWETLVSAHPWCLRDIEFVNADLGFAAGGNAVAAGGKLARTDDGGASWDAVTPPDLPDTEILMPKQSAKTPANCLAVDFFGAEVGLALCTTSTLEMTGYNALFRTTDGGDTWKIMPGFREGFGGKSGNLMLVSMPAYAMAMPDCHQGWVVGMGNLIHRYEAADTSLDCASGGSGDDGEDDDGGDGGTSDGRGGDDDCGCRSVGTARETTLLDLVFQAGRLFQK